MTRPNITKYLPRNLGQFYGRVRFGAPRSHRPNRGRRPNQTETSSLTKSGRGTSNLYKQGYEKQIPVFNHAVVATGSIF